MKSTNPLALLLVTAPLLFTAFAPAGLRTARADGLDVIVDVIGLRSDRGEVRGALFGSADGWTHEGRELTTCTAHVGHLRARCIFRDVTPGSYAIAVLHDEDDDGQMDRDVFGIPQEGFAFSNDAAPVLGPPSFGNARFVHGHEDTRLMVHTRYGI